MTIDAWPTDEQMAFVCSQCGHMQGQHEYGGDMRAPCCEQGCRCADFDTPANGPFAAVPKSTETGEG